MVKSVAGRDGGSYAFVVGEPEPGYVLIADGRIRKVENPKRKKLKHIRFIADAPRLDDKKVTNRMLRELLSEYSGHQTDKEE